MGDERTFDLQERLIEFAVRITSVVEALPQNRIGNHVAGQLARCGTSPAPNYAEAQAAESRADFIHKMKIALKELRETKVWIEIIKRKPLVKLPKRLDPVLEECDALTSIFYTSIRTAEANRRKSAKKRAKT